MSQSSIPSPMDVPSTATNPVVRSSARPKRPPHYDRPDYERVVITGMGAVTPLGLDVASTWQALVNGESGITSITHFDTSDYRAQFFGEVTGFKANTYLSAKDAKRYDTFMHYALAASSMALLDAGFIETISADPEPVKNVDSTRFGVIIGSGIGGMQTLENGTNTLTASGARRVSPFVIPGALINLASGLVAMKHGLQGPNLATATACSSGAHAIGLAARLIAYGDCDVMLAGGSEKGSSMLGMAGFAAMGALSTRNDAPEQASRPFDKDRDGFVLGDGAGALVLESLSHAKARGAKILAEVAGFGMSDDAHHITSPPTDGEGAARAMRHAITDAGIDACHIGYVNAHATSTPAGDVAESFAIERVFRECPSIAVSATKSMTGHLLGAAGAVEAIFSVLALQHQILPPTINLDNVDEQCHLDYVPHHARQVQGLTYTMSNSFGFGGTNGALVFAQWPLTR